MEKIMHSKKFIKIICIVGAILLWLYVSYQENPSMTETVKNVPIVISGEQALKENGLSVYSVSEKSVDVKVTAKRLTLARLTNKTLTATLNVSSIKKSGKHVIPVAITSNNSSSASYYVKGNDITVIIEPILKETRDITATVETPNDNTIKLDSYALSKEKVTVSAPKSLIADIGSIRTDRIITEKKSGSQNARLYVYAKNGKILEGVECNPAEITVNYNISDVKTLPVVLKTSDGKTHSLPDQYKVEVYGADENFNSLKEIETEEINLANYKAGSSVKLKLNVPKCATLSKDIEEIEIELEEEYYSDNKEETE